MENNLENALKHIADSGIGGEIRHESKGHYTFNFDPEKIAASFVAYAAQFQAAPARIVGDEEIEDASDDRWDVLKKDRLCWEDRVGFFTGFSSGAKWALSRQTAIVQDESNKRIDALKLSLAKMLKTYVYDLDADGNPKASVSEIMAMLEEVNNNL